MTLHGDRGHTRRRPAISRYAALLDLLINWNKIHEPGVFELVEESMRTRISAGEGQLFTTSYFHFPSDLAEEIFEAAFQDVEVFQIEGGLLVADFSDRWNDPVRKEALLRAARLVELEPSCGARRFLLWPEGLIDGQFEDIRPCLWFYSGPLWLGRAATPSYKPGGTDADG